MAGGGFRLVGDGLKGLSSFGEVWGQGASAIGAARGASHAILREYMHSSRNVSRTQVQMANAISSTVGRLLGSGAHGAGGATGTVADDVLKSTIEAIKTKLERDLKKAGGSVLGRRRALMQAQSSLSRVNLTGTLAENQTMVEGLRKGNERRLQALNTNLFGFTKQMRIASTAFSVLSKTVSGTYKGFKFVNDKVNQFARLQMAVTGERAGYGRQISGAGINFGHMMSAIGTGRRAGMDDAAVVSRMVGMQTQLARARWGEGAMIENLGKWGLTPFDENGNMKSQHQVMIDISNKFNALSSDMEKLQFLDMQGFKPEERKFVENFARDAARWENIKGNKRLQGTLEDAQILGENGMAARIDAATKIEQKRRDILNQNAIEEGLLPGIKRMMDPENWLLSDWTARQQGVAAAQSEDAMDALTSALKDQTRALKEQGKGIQKGSLSGNESTLSVKQLKSLSLSSGWADANLKNLGSKSAVNILKKAIDDKVNSREMREKEQGTGRNEWSRTGALIGGTIGLIGGIAATVGTGGLGGVALPGMITAGAIAGSTALGALGGMWVGDKTGDVWQNHFATYSSDDVEKAKKAAKKGGDKWEQWKKEHRMPNLTRSQVLDIDFDQKALEGAKIQSLITRATELAGGKEVNIEALGGDRYLDTMTRGLRSGSTEFEDRVVEAIARTADATIGKGEAILRILERGIETTDPEVAKRIGELTKANINKGMSGKEAVMQATAQAKDEFLSQENETGDLINEYIKSKKTPYEEYYDAHSQVSKGAISEHSGILERLRAEKNKTKGQGSKTFDEYLEGLRAKGKEKGGWAVDLAFRLEELEASSKGGLKHTSTGKTWGEVGAGVSKEDFVNSKLGVKNTEELERKAYDHIYGEKGVMKGKKAPWQSLSNTLKRDRIAEYLNTDSNFGSSVWENVAEQIGDDAIVERLALENDTTADDIRNNILSEEDYNKLKTSRDKGGMTLSKSDTAKMRIYESSKNYKDRESARQKQEKQAQEDQERRMTDYATYTEAARLLGTTDGGKFKEIAEASGGKVEFSAADEKRLKELQREEQIDHLAGQNLGTEKQNELNALLKKKSDSSNSKVDRKKLIQLVGLASGNLGDYFSKDEIDEFNKQQAEEKANFLQGGKSSEAKYALYKDIESRMLRGDAVSEKEKAMFEKEKSRVARNAKKNQGKKANLHEEAAYSEEEQAAIDAAFGSADEATAAHKRHQKLRPLAETSDLRRMKDLRKQGWTDAQLAQNFGKERLKQFKEAEADGSLRRIDRKPLLKKDKSQLSSREAYEKNFKARLDAVGGYTQEQRDQKLKEEMEWWDKTHKKKGKDATGQQGGKKAEGEPGFPKDNLTGILQGKEEGVAQAADKMAAAESAAEAAAASGNKAEASNTNITNNENMNFDQNITVNINGSGAGSASDIKEGVGQAGDNLVSKVANAVSGTSRRKDSQ